MISLWNTKPQHDVAAAVKELRNILKPGDVINIDGYDPLLKPWVSIPHWAIRKHQKELFGKDSNYRDTHTTAYFGPDKIFSVTTPKVRWETIEHNAFARFTVLRYTKHDLSDAHISIMFDIAKSLIGIKYDYGQLLDIALNGILGYDHIIKYKWFDLGKRRTVCSAGVRTLYEGLRYQLLANAGIDPDAPIGRYLGEGMIDLSGCGLLNHVGCSTVNVSDTLNVLHGTPLYVDSNGMAMPLPMHRLFNRLNPSYWSQDEIDNFTRTNVEATSPGHFSCSYMFAGEFRPILDWKMFL